MRRIQSANLSMKHLRIAGLDVEEHVRIDQKYFRPTEVEVLIAEARKITQDTRLETFDKVQRSGKDHGGR